MAGLTTSERNSILSTESAKFAYVSLHTADPGQTGTNEVTGGSPAYARKTATWGSPSSGQISASAVTFDVPANLSTGYTHLGFWSAATNGTFYGSIALAAAQLISPQGQVTVTPTWTQS